MREGLGSGSGEEHRDRDLSQPPSRPDALLARVALGGAAATTSVVSRLKLCLDPLCEPVLHDI